MACLVIGNNLVGTSTEGTHMEPDSEVPSPSEGEGEDEGERRKAVGVSTAGVVFSTSVPSPSPQSSPFKGEEVKTGPYETGSMGLPLRRVSSVGAHLCVRPAHY